MAVEEILDARRQGGRTDGQMLATYQRMWKTLSLWGFVADINAMIRQEGPSILLYDVFNTSLPAVLAEVDDDDCAIDLDAEPVTRKKIAKAQPAHARG